MREVQKADPDARKRALLLTGIAIGMGVVMFALRHFADATVTGWFRVLGERIAHNPSLGAAVMWLSMLPLVVFAVYTFRFGSRVVRARRMPPPGHKVVKDTLVHLEQAAVLRGRLAQVLASALLVLSIIIPAFFWYTLEHILRGPSG